jgi:hypothetical protein
MWKGELVRAVVRVFNPSVDGVHGLKNRASGNCKSLDCEILRDFSFESG